MFKCKKKLKKANYKGVAVIYYLKVKKIQLYYTYILRSF